MGVDISALLNPVQNKLEIVKSGNVLRPPTLIVGNFLEPPLGQAKRDRRRAKNKI